MNSESVPIIDWRRQITGLEPFFASRGGVVRVQASDGSPASNFSKAIRQLMTEGEWGRPWRCVQLDVRNPNTHYLEDVLAQLVRSLGLEEAGSAVRDGGVQIGTGIEADRVEISNVKVISREDEFARTSRSLLRIDQVARGIENRLEAERIALLFLNSHTFDKGTLSRFRSLLWDEYLEGMTEAGLLLIDISDPSRSECPDWPPDPDLLLDLPVWFDDDSRREAHADLAKMALNEALFSSPAEADAFAKTLLDTSETIRDMYARLGRMRARPGGAG